MNELKQRRRALLIVRGAVLWVLAGIFVSNEPSQADVATNRFGFIGKEIFPIDYQIGHLRAGDLDGNGLNDLVIVNNLRSKINLLYNRTGQIDLSEIATESKAQEINDLPPDARFRLDSIASEKRISSMTVADLNSDGRPDIAYYGEPKELILQLNEGNNTWSAPKRWPLESGLLNPNALVHGDINGDKRTDLLLLADSFVYVLHQEENGSLGELVRIPYTGPVLAVQVLDIQGDGRDDLLLVNWDSLNPFRFRLQNSQGQLGPEIHLALPPIRSYWADDLDGDGRTEVITIALKSGRAQISHFIPEAAESLSGAWRRGQFQVLPLAKTTKAKRGILWADLNEDRRPDLLVAEPDSGQMTVYLQQPDGTLAAPRTFPTLTGVSEIAAADWDGDGQTEIFLLSADERQVGVTKWDRQGRIPFPQTLPVEGRPLALAAGALSTHQAPSVVVVTDIESRRELVILSAQGTARRQRLNENFKSNPRSMAVHDLDQDGRADIVILIPYEKLKVLVQRADKNDFEELDVAPPGGSVDQPWSAVSDVDGDGYAELLLAQKNFLRAVVLDKAGLPEGDNPGRARTLKVKEQINGVASNSNLIGATALRNGTNAVDSLFLLDAERKSLTLCERDGSGVWQVVRDMPLPVTDFSSLQAVALGQPQPNSVAFLGNNSVAWMTLAGETWRYVELDGYESPINDGYLLDVVSGDLNHDRRKDLVFLETRKNYLDIVTFEAPHRLVPANRWQVFEERTFRSRRTDAPEPREALVADFNNDRKNDLAIVVHDRIILYLQE